jgi:Protein of unknown function (DUF5818)
MRKLSMVAAMLLLSSAWVLAQSGTAPSDQNPSSSSPSQTSPSQTSPSQTSPSQTSPSSTQSDQSQTSAGGQTVEGCVSGSAGSYTLTDASGTTYQLSGDTSKLADHVGHQVRVTGDSGAGAAGASSGASSGGAAGGSNTINVKKVKMISSSCPSK